MFKKLHKTAAVATEFEQQLRSVSLRVTQPRLAVLTAVNTHPHSDTDSIIATVRQNLPGVSHQAVYDSLHALTEASLLRKIQPSGLVARYESRVGDNHHHVVCRSCRRIDDIDCAVGDPPCMTPSDDHGFVIDETEVIHWGLCPDCAAAARVDADKITNTTDETTSKIKKDS